ncbi:LacI family DNA-binding transcriptional regulator [Allorhizocola rhizosphaerae]|uniref:LacI family DNA-binding transcriptional regulator n=1 Tax=Allorhizocola rhizosphaerae TaxID=1872709 RepID=UPI000E3DE8D2|nr:LacI family DNA-binding transcriptional regulator [Allorhizocola rhizosphaerae]
MTTSTPHTSTHRVTLEDVAREAGVSRATASRVITGCGPSSAEARDRVIAAVKALGYIPDAAARALVGGHGFRLVVAVTGHTPSTLDDPYVDRFVASVAVTCATRGIGVSLQWLPYRDPDQVRRLAKDRSARAVLLLNATDAVLRAVPAALTGRIASIGLGSTTVPVFDVDLAGATAAMVYHLYDKGRRRIAMVSGPAWMPCVARSVETYRSLMQAGGLPFRLVRSNFTADGGKAAARTALCRWPDTDAVIAGNDAVALGIIAALRGQGRNIPGDVAVCGFDDIPFAVLSTPTLTTSTHPVERIATAATTAVLDGSWASPATYYPSQLICRESA